MSTQIYQYLTSKDWRAIVEEEAPALPVFSRPDTCISSYHLPALEGLEVFWFGSSGPSSRGDCLNPDDDGGIKGQWSWFLVGSRDPVIGGIHLTLENVEYMAASGRLRVPVRCSLAAEFIQRRRKSYD